jgi:hypothetical protein
MTQPSRSPIKDRPLRAPGQSLEEEKRRLIEDKYEAPAIMALFFVGLAALEWWRYATSAPPQPVLLTGVAVLAVAFAAWRLLRLRPQLRRLRQGIDGERAVGQYLERLRSGGYEVFHDLIGEGFNVDHVAIGPAGVFTIETKTWSKPAKGEPRIDFDGERLTAVGHEPARDPIIQAKAQASWLQRLVLESTGRRVTVRPVVVFPGWFVQQSEGSRRDVWVLEPKALPGFLQHEDERLSPADVKLISYHLSRYIRASEAKRP